MTNEADTHTETPERRDGASRREWIVVLATLAVGVLILFSRRPDAILHPQFFIEDGTIWFSEAHEVGLVSLFKTSYRGYLHTVPRLGALAALAVPLLWAPLVMSALSTLTGALPAAFVASRRFAALLPDLRWRLLAAFLCVASPGIWTTMANMTHSQWHFALLAGLVVVAAPPETRAGKTFDVVATVLSGLTGPTVVFLAPVAVIAWLARRTRWSLVLAAISAALAPVQLLCIWLTKAPDEGGLALAASVAKFVAIFARRVVYAVFLGEVGSAGLFADAGSPLLHPASLAAVFAVGLAVIVAIAWRGPLELELLTLYAALVYLAGLWWPPASSYDEAGYWTGLMAQGNGNRYFVIPIFVALLTLVWAASRAGFVAVRVAAMAAIVVVLAVGVRLDWREPAPRDFGYAQYVRAYDRAAPGERVQVVEPPGWSFILTKR